MSKQSTIRTAVDIKSHNQKLKQEPISDPESESESEPEMDTTTTTTTTAVELEDEGGDEYIETTEQDEVEEEVELEEAEEELEDLDDEAEVASCDDSDTLREIDEDEISRIRLDSAVERAETDAVHRTAKRDLERLSRLNEESKLSSKKSSTPQPEPEPLKLKPRPKLNDQIRRETFHDQERTGMLDNEAMNENSDDSDGENEDAIDRQYAEEGDLDADNNIKDLISETIEREPKRIKGKKRLRKSPTTRSAEARTRLRSHTQELVDEEEQLSDASISHNQTTTSNKKRKRISEDEEDGDQTDEAELPEGEIEKPKPRSSSSNSKRRSRPSSSSSSTKRVTTPAPSTVVKREIKPKPKRGGSYSLLILNPKTKEKTELKVVVIAPPTSYLSINPASGKPNWHELQPAHYATVKLSTKMTKYIIIAFDTKYRPHSIGDNNATACEKKLEIADAVEYSVRWATAVTDQNMVRDPITNEVVRLHMPCHVFENSYAKQFKAITDAEQGALKKEPTLYAARVIGSLLQGFLSTSSFQSVHSILKPQIEMWKQVAEVPLRADAIFNRQQVIETMIKQTFLQSLQTRRTEATADELSDEDIAQIAAETCMDTLYGCMATCDRKLNDRVLKAIDMVDERSFDEHVMNELDVEQNMKQEDAD